MRSPAEDDDLTTIQFTSPIGFVRADRDVDDAVAIKISSAHPNT